MKVLTAQDELTVFKRKHDESQQIIQEKDDALAAKQYIIIGLCTLVVILIAALAFLIMLLLRFRATIGKQKQSTRIANEHNELKSQFIGNILAQMEPTLNTLTASAGQLPGAQEMVVQVEALKNFSEHIQELSSLESSLTETCRTFSSKPGKNCYAISARSSRTLDSLNSSGGFCERSTKRMSSNRGKSANSATS